MYRLVDLNKAYKIKIFQRNKLPQSTQKFKTFPFENKGNKMHEETIYISINTSLTAGNIFFISMELYNWLQI